MTKFSFLELKPELWDDYETLFGANGACDGCWCACWRLEEMGKLWEETKGEKAKVMMKGLIQNGKAMGVLAYADERPVGWCSFGPRAHFPLLEKVKEFKCDDITGVWCINCFYISEAYRGKGIARGLLAEAVKAIQRHGGNKIEAYPVTTTIAGERVPPDFAFMGPLGIFEELGFKEVQCVTPTRPVVRLEINSQISG